MDALEFVISVKSDGAISAVSQLSTSLKGLSSMMGQVRNMSLVTIAQGFQQFNQAIQETITPGADFQQGMADLSAITGITGKDLEKLGVDARKMGEETGIGAERGVESYKLLASNIQITAMGGVEGLKKLQKETIKLAQAAGTDLPMAADTMTFALNQFQLPVSEASRVINVLGAGAKYGAAQIPALAESLKEAGTVSRMAGLSIEETTGAIEVLSQRGIKGAEAGTMLRNIILALQTKDIPGIDIKTQGFVGSLKAMQKYMGDATYMTHIFRRESLGAAEVLIGGADAVENMTNKVTNTQVAYEQAAIRTNTYKHTIALIEAQMESYKISIFNATGAMLPWIAVTGNATAEFSKIVPAIFLFRDMIRGSLSHIILFVKGLKEAKTAQQALNFAFTKSPIGIVIAGLTVLAGVILFLKTRTHELSNEEKALNDVKIKSADYSAKERVENDRLFDSLKKTNPQSKERKDLIQQLNDKYPKLLENMHLETAGAQEIAAAYRSVVTEIDRKSRAQAWDDLLAEKYKKVVEQTIKADEEVASNKPYETRIKVLEAQYKNASFNQKGEILKEIQANKNMINEGAQKELTEIKSQRDAVFFKRQQDMMASSTGPKLGGSGVSPLLTAPGMEGEKNGAMASVTGDSKAIKNINITIDSFIKTNNNIVENGVTDLNALQAKMKAILMNILNDVNYSAG
jgi:TP901 family phage tail tape measure protein